MVVVVVVPERAKCFVPKFRQFPPIGYFFLRYGGPSVSWCFHCSFPLVIQKSNSFPLLKLEFNSVFIFNLKLILKLISNQY